MEFLLRVMKNTWLLPPDLTDAKNTCLEGKKALINTRGMELTHARLGLN